MLYPTYAAWVLAFGTRCVTLCLIGCHFGPLFGLSLRCMLHSSKGLLLITESQCGDKRLQMTCGCWCVVMRTCGSVLCGDLSMLNLWHQGFHFCCRECAATCGIHENPGSHCGSIHFMLVGRGAVHRGPLLSLFHSPVLVYCCLFSFLNYQNKI